MAIFNRKQKDKSVDNGTDPDQKEKVKFSKRPASGLACIRAITGETNSRFQTLLSNNND